MTTCRFIKKLFRFKGLIIKSFEFKRWGRELHLTVKPHKNGCLCPKCLRRCRIVKVNKELRCWMDVTVFGIRIFLWYNPKDIKCPIHGRIQENIPWAAPYARITYRFEYVILVYSQVMAQKAAAKLLYLPQSTLSDLLHRTIKRIRKDRKIRGLKTVGVDEISYCKGRKYATVVYDLDRCCVVWVGKGKGRETIDRFFKEELSKHQLAQIKWASCDMSEAYIGAIEKFCPNVKLVLDHFHIVKALNSAVDEIRKDAWRDATPDHKKAFRGLRWLLFKHSENRSNKDTRLLNNLKNGNNKIFRAWILKDEFEQFWKYIYSGSAEKFLKSWITKALKSRLEPMRKVAITLRKHLERLLTFIESRLTNAVSEGINRIIKIVKNRASGFQNLKSFTDIIFLTIGNVNIPEQIPENFRIL